MDTKFREDFDAKVTSFGERGIRSLAVTVANTVNDECKMAGIFCFLDPPRPDTKDTIEKANKYSVAVKMMTGDHTLIARETARSLGMGTNILHSSHLPTLDENGDAPKDLVEKFGRKILETDGFAQMYPSHISTFNLWWMLFNVWVCVLPA
jgi:H+-transporting ATPase